MQRAPNISIEMFEAVQSSSICKQTSQTKKEENTAADFSLRNII